MQEILFMYWKTSVKYRDSHSLPINTPCQKGHWSQSVNLYQHIVIARNPPLTSGFTPRAPLQAGQTHDDRVRHYSARVCSLP